MELSAFVIYLIGLIDELKDTLSALEVFCIIVLIPTVCACILFMDHDEIHKPLKKVFIVTTWVLGVGLVLNLFVPSSKTVIAMVTVPAVINNEEAQKLPTNLVRFINEYLEESIQKNQKENL